MASLFRARRQAAEGGSGGKILHDRLRDPPQRPSPYARSPPLALPPPPAPPPAGSPRWFLGLVSGAGKLISSVFRADSSSPDSSDYSSDHDRSSSRSDEQNIDAPKQLRGSSQELTKSEEIADCMEVSHAIDPVSETKLAIQKLLQQETFSRDECERLTKLLQSRVVDSPSVFVQDKVGEAISNGLPGNAVEFSGTWLSLQQCNVLPGSEVHDDASPVYLAKSYMQSLPPQQPPSGGNITLSSMIASKEDKIKESPDNNKKPHLILADTLLENPSSKLIDSQELFQMETSKISSAADERDPNFLRTVQFSFSQSLPEASDAPAKSLVEHVEDLCRNDDGNLVDKPIDEDVTTVAVKSTFATLTSEPMETTISSLGPTLSDTPTEHKSPSYLDANKDVVKASSAVLEDFINDDVPHESFISASASKVPDDAKSHDQNDCSPHTTDGSGNEFSKNGGSPESNVNPQVFSLENESFTQFSDGEQTPDVAKVITEHPSMDTVPAHEENHITTKSPKVTKRKSIERVSVSPRPRTRQQAKVIKEHPNMDTMPAPGEIHITTKSPKVAKRKSIERISVSPRPRTRRQAEVIKEHPSMDTALASEENHITTKSLMVTKRKSIERVSVSPQPRTRQQAEVIKEHPTLDTAPASGENHITTKSLKVTKRKSIERISVSPRPRTRQQDKVIKEHPSMDTAPALGENHITTKSPKVTKRKSIGRVSVSPQPRTRPQAEVIKEHPSLDTAPASGEENHITTKSPKVTKRKSIERISVSPRPRTRQQAKVIKQHPSMDKALTPRENHITTKSPKVTERKSIEHVSVSPQPRTRQQAEVNKEHPSLDTAQASGENHITTKSPKVTRMKSIERISVSPRPRTRQQAEVIKEHPSMDTASPPGENHITTKSPKVTKRNSIERVSVSPQPRTRQQAEQAEVIKEHPSLDTAPASGENHITTKSPKVTKRKSIERISVSPRPRTRQQAEVIKEHPSMDTAPAPGENHLTTKSPKVTKRKSIVHVSVSPRPSTRLAKREGKMGRERGQKHWQGRVST